MRRKTCIKLGAWLVRYNGTDNVYLYDYLCFMLVSWPLKPCSHSGISHKVWCKIFVDSTRNLLIIIYMKWRGFHIKGVFTRDIGHRIHLQFSIKIRMKSTSLWFQWEIKICTEIRISLISMGNQNPLWNQRLGKLFDTYWMRIWCGSNFHWVGFLKICCKIHAENPHQKQH